MIDKNTHYFLFVLNHHLYLLKGIKRIPYNYKFPDKFCFYSGQSLKENEQGVCVRIIEMDDMVELKKTIPDIDSFNNFHFLSEESYEYLSYATSLEEYLSLFMKERINSIEDYFNEMRTLREAYKLYFKRLRNQVPPQNSIFKHWKDRLGLDDDPKPVTRTRTKNGKKRKKQTYNSKDSHYCFKCFEKGNVSRCHIKPLNIYEDNSKENLHLLCRKCHQESDFIMGEDYWKWFYKDRKLIRRAYIPIKKTNELQYPRNALLRPKHISP